MYVCVCDVSVHLCVRKRVCVWGREGGARACVWLRERDKNRVHVVLVYVSVRLSTFPPPCEYGREREFPCVIIALAGRNTSKSIDVYNSLVHRGSRTNQWPFQSAAEQLVTYLIGLLL